MRKKIYQSRFEFAKIDNNERKYANIFNYSEYIILNKENKKINFNEIYLKDEENLFKEIFEFKK